MPIVSVVDDWWGGRNVRELLPRLFFSHFPDTSFVAESDGLFIGFLVGFLSQASPEEAYIHFVGVHPDFRTRGLGRTLYQYFFDEAKKRGRSSVRCITSPVNKGSIAFHAHMGFLVERGDGEADGVSVHSNYDGVGGSRVLFAKRLGE